MFDIKHLSVFLFLCLGGDTITYATVEVQLNRQTSTGDHEMTDFLLLEIKAGPFLLFYYIVVLDHVVKLKHGILGLVL